MKKESTVHPINPEQLQRLFDIGRDVEKSDRMRDSSQQRADLLCHSLSQPLALEKSQIDMLPAALGQLCHSLGLLAGDTISQMLSNPSTDIAAIKRIKRWSKDLSTQAKSAVENDVAIAIYYASIAHALVFHKQRITRFSYEKLEGSFSCLAKEEWISKDLSVLLKTAGNYCNEKARL